MDPYQILKLPRSASEQQIKERFRFLAQIFHPDRLATFSDELRSQAEAEFKEMSAAYAILSNPQERKAYDAANPVYEDINKLVAERGQLIGALGEAEDTIDDLQRRLKEAEDGRDQANKEVKQKGRTEQQTLIAGVVVALLIIVMYLAAG